MITHCFRLKRGQDLYLSIVEYAKANQIMAATILSSVGCVSRAKVRDASGVTIKEINEDMEIISVNGTVSENRTHLHISLSKEDLSVIGGHLKEGTIINTTCEVVLLEMEDLHFSEEFDSETGYDELLIEKIKPWRKI